MLAAPYVLAALVKAAAPLSELMADYHREASREITTVIGDAPAVVDSVLTLGTDPFHRPPRRGDRRSRCDGRWFNLRS